MFLEACSFTLSKLQFSVYFFVVNLPNCLIIDETISLRIYGWWGECDNKKSKHNLNLFKIKSMMFQPPFFWVGFSWNLILNPKSIEKLIPPNIKSSNEAKIKTIKILMKLLVIRIVPNNFLLVPGVGAQGGNLHEVCKYGLNENVGLLINSSRGIIYASNGEDFAEQATIKAKELQVQMEGILG